MLHWPGAILVILMANPYYALAVQLCTCMHLMMIMTPQDASGTRHHPWTYLLSCCSVISTSLDTIKGALAKLSRCHDASSKPINHPDRTVAHRRVYFLIQREVVQHKSMESLLSKDKAREALRQLEALDDQISWGLVIIDELHQ